MGEQLCVERISVSYRAVPDNKCTPRGEHSENTDAKEFILSGYRILGFLDFSLAVDAYSTLKHEIGCTIVRIRRNFYSQLVYIFFFLILAGV